MPRTLIVAALLTTAMTPAWADGLAACAAIDADSARLACYDKLAERTPHPAQPPVVRTAPAALPSKQDFGAEQLPQRSSGQAPEAQAITAHIAGSFEGWEPKARLTLDNGQVWQVTDDRSVYYKPTLNPEVTIEKGMFGSYFLRVDGVNSRAKVRRIK